MVLITLLNLVVLTSFILIKTNGREDYKPSIFDIDKSLRVRFGAEPLDTCGRRPIYEKGRSVNSYNNNTQSTRAKASYRIANGTHATVGQFPSFAYVSIGPNICGGVLIGPYAVLASTHCVANDHINDLIIVVLGLNSPRSKAIQEHEVDEIYYDEKFCIHDLNNGHIAKNDLLILKLASKVEYNQYVQPVCLNYDLDDYYKPNKVDNFLVAGMGMINKEAELSDRLYHAIMNKSCNDYEDESNTIACYKPIGPNQVCHGDSGGPLYYYRNLNKQQTDGNGTQKEDSRAFLAGTLSFGHGHCEPRPALAMFNDMQRYESFIRKKLIKFSKFEQGKTLKDIKCPK